MYSNKDALETEAEFKKVTIFDSNPGSYVGLGSAITYEDLNI